MIRKVGIQNFRLLRSIELLFEEQSTVIVGRNNSGKTSLAELFRRLMEEQNPTFSLHDFSLCTHEAFWEAYLLNTKGQVDEAIKTLPIIRVSLTLGYDPNASELGHLAEFIVDLNPECTDASIEISYELTPGRLKTFFDIPELNTSNSEPQNKTIFFQAIKERIRKNYKCSLTAVDPSDLSNRKTLDWSKLRLLIQGNFISAQRGLDDTTHKENDILGRILNSLFSTAESESADQNDRQTTRDLRAAVSEIQASLDAKFNEQLKKLLPTINMFGYPGLADPNILTETLLNVELLLKNHTRVCYSGLNGVHLPEAYNGLGTRNLIYILLKLLEAFKAFGGRPTTPSAHLIFIEEPEAHLHPQMQEVFIKQLTTLAKVFSDKYSPDTKWPVQFIVSTHSSHITNRVQFEAMRYFMAAPDPLSTHLISTKVKDLKNGFGKTPIQDKEFLHKYMTLTRCDLLFADKAILIEGTTERILMPRIIEKIDTNRPQEKRLGQQYISYVEVGGAHAHIFFGLLDFLELKTLIITDLDAVDGSAHGKACVVSKGTRTSNACINNWFGKNHSPAELIKKTAEEKTKGLQRLAYQIPEQNGIPCGRSFEDAFMFANPPLFPPGGADVEDEAWNAAKAAKKSDFALRHAIHETNWKIPRYIEEGLLWLGDSPPTSSPALPANSQVAA